MTNIIQDEFSDNVLDEMGNDILDETINPPVPGIGKNPTGWNFNPIASEADLINYDVSTEPYDNSLQPYDGYASNFPSPNTPKNPTAYTPLSELYQQYYGGPTQVPLFAAPLRWDYNPGIFNEQGQYVTGLSGSANVRPYDESNITYDNNNPDTNYDGTNGSKSFQNWKSPTGWTPITGGSF